MKQAMAHTVLLETIVQNHLPYHFPVRLAHMHQSLVYLFACPVYKGIIVLKVATTQPVTHAFQVISVPKEQLYRQRILVHQEHITLTIMQQT